MTFSATYALLTDAELNTYIPSDQGSSIKSPPLAFINNAAALKLEDMCGGTAFVQRSFTEDHSGGLVGRLGGLKRLYLNRTPIVSVTSITDDDSNTVAATDYTIVGTLGNSYLEFDGVMPAPVGRWTVIYTAGVFATTAAITWDVKVAALALVRQLRDNKGVTSTSSSLSGRAGSRARSRAQTSPISSVADLGLPSKYVRRMV
jgi:hypothetical protein